VKHGSDVIEFTVGRAAPERMIDQLKSERGFKGPRRQLFGGNVIWQKTRP
jgi:hypothetical protein